MPSTQVESKPIIDCACEVLFRSKVPLCGLYRGMPQQQLDLLEIATGLAIELRAGPAQVVGSQFSKLRLAGVADDQAPDRLLILDGTSIYYTALGNRPEERPLGDADRSGPDINSRFHARGDGDGAGAISFSNQVRDNPSGLSLLELTCSRKTRPFKTGVFS